MTSEIMGWLQVAVLGGLLAAGSLAAVRARMTERERGTDRPAPGGWKRSRLPLAGFAVGLLLFGAGLGGAVASFEWPSFGSSGLGGLVEFGPEPLEEVEGAEWDSPSTESTLPPTEPAWPAGDAVDPDDPSEADEAPEEDVASPVVPEAAPAATPSPSATLVARFAVRAGVFRDRENADALQEELRAAGYPPFLVPRDDSSGATVFWVYAGTFATRESADVAVRELARIGVEAIVVNASEIEPGS